MKKRILGFVLAICLILPCAFMLNACSKKNYTISFEENGGSLVTDITTQEGNQISPPTIPTKDGYTFEAWFLSKDFSEAYIFGKMPSENKTLYAKWNVNNYEISYELNGGVLTESNPETYNIESDSITLNNPTKTGFVFAGWTSSNGTTPQTELTFPEGTIGDLTFTANWTINKHSVSIVVNDSNYGSVDTTSLSNIDYNTVISANNNVLTIGTNTITATAATATAEYTYIFDEWQIKYGSSDYANLMATDKVTNNLEIKAVFSREINKYGVCWKNGEAVLQDGDFDYNTTSSYIGNVPTKAASNEFTYSFIGWSTDKDATIPAFTTNTSGNITGATTYYAIFSKTVRSYGVCWMNGEAVLQDGDVNYNATSSYIGNVPTKAASSEFTYSFIGWSIDKNATTPAFTTNTSGNITGVTTFYAIYEQTDRTYPAEVKISFDGADIFGTILQKIEATNLYETNINNGDNISIKYDASVEVQSNGVILIEGLQPFKAVAKEAAGNYSYTFLYWQINDVINLSYDSENSENNILSMESKILTSIKAVFERESLVKENNGTLVLKIDGENVASPYTYAGETYALSATGNKGTAPNTFTVVNGTGEATISGSTLTVTKAGTLTIKVNNAGDGGYLPATELSVNIEIKKGNPGLSYAETILVKHVGDIFTNPITNPYGLQIEYSSNSSYYTQNVYTVSETGEVHIKNELSSTSSVEEDDKILGVRAEYGGDDLWQIVVRDYTIKVVPEVELRIENNNGIGYNIYEDSETSFTTSETYEGATFTIWANSSATLNDTLSIVSGGTGEATIEGDILTLTKAGTIIIRVEATSTYYSNYSHDFTITFNKGEIVDWNEDIQIGGVSLYDYDEDAYLTTQSANFTAIACVYSTTTQIPATYSSSDTNIATVNATTGEVTILGEAGQTVEITATINFTDDDLWKDLTNYTITYTLTIGE